MSEKTYNDHRFNKLSEKINSIVISKLNNSNLNSRINQSYDKERTEDKKKVEVKSKIFSKNNSKAQIEENSDGEKYKLNEEENSFDEENFTNEISNLKNLMRNEKPVSTNFTEDSYQGTNLLTCNIENKIETLEEETFEILKDHELKANLMKEEINYLIRQIQQEKEEKEELNNKVYSEIQECETNIVELIETERAKTESAIAQFFLEIEKSIENLPITTKSILNDDNDLDNDKLKINQLLSSLKQKLLIEESQNEKEIQNFVDAVNFELKNCSDSINLEKQNKEENENLILNHIETCLKQLKLKFLEIKNSREAFEEEIFNRLEQTCTDLVLNFQENDE